MSMVGASLLTCLTRKGQALAAHAQILGAAFRHLWESWSFGSVDLWTKDAGLVFAHQFAHAPGTTRTNAARATTRPAWLLAGSFLVLLHGAYAN